MAKSLFSKKISKRCDSCVHSAFSTRGDKLLCRRRGLVERDGKCFRFRYDPFKRVPAKTPPLPAHSKEDFAL